MDIRLEISIIDSLGNRFETFDLVEIQLNNGNFICGYIQPMKTIDSFCIDTGGNLLIIKPEDVYVMRVIEC